MVKSFQSEFVVYISFISACRSYLGEGGVTSPKKSRGRGPISPEGTTTYKQHQIITL
jgi:hypothetical protein